jgi:hypothetical protein
MNVALPAGVVRARAELRSHDHLAAVGLAVTSAPESVGVRGIAIDIQAVDAIPRTALGKAPLIRAERPLARPAGLQ